MSLFFARQAAAEARDISMADWIRGIDGSGKTKAGETVTADKALKVDAMWSSVHLLASLISNLPVDVFRGVGTDKTPVSPLPGFVASPSLILDRQDWVYQAMVSLLLRGNAYGMVLARGAGQLPQTVEWLNPDDVTVEQKSSLRAPTYKVKHAEVPAGDIVHLRAFTKPGSAVGLSPVQYRAETLGISLAAQGYGAGFYGGGGHPSAVFMNKAMQTIPDDKADSIKQRVLAAMQGRREPLVIGSDWSYTPLQVNPAEADFVNSMGYSDAAIARMYGPGVAEVLGYQVSGSSLTYSNRVDRSLDLLTYTADPWVTKFNTFWTKSIPRPQTARLNVNALLRADPKTRHEMYRTDREIGLYNIDELRALEDLSPLPDGLGQDYTPLKTSSPTTPPGGPNANQ